MLTYICQWLKKRLCMPCIFCCVLHSMYFMMALGTFFVVFGRVAYKHQTPQHHKILIPSISVEPRKSRQFPVQSGNLSILSPFLNRNNIDLKTTTYIRRLSIKVLEDPCKTQQIIARVQTSTTNGPIYAVLISICSFIRHTWYNHLYVKISPKFRWTFIPAKETASSWPAIVQVNIIVFSWLMLVCPLDTRKVLPLPCLGKLGRFSSAPAQEKKKAAKSFSAQLLP